MDKTSSLTPFEYGILFNKNTEKPFIGKYNETTTDGTYLCRSCGISLFRATSKFVSSCGWPSFDASINQNVKQLPDIDARLRTYFLWRRLY